MKNLGRFLLFSLIPLGVVACSGSQKEEQPPTSEALSPITIQLSWVHEYSAAPFHVAAQAGYFAEEGIDITLAEGGFNENGFIDPVQEVLSGNADFAMSDGASLIIARANGLPLVAVTSILQRSPLAVISLEENGIARPQDIIGKRISVARGGAETIYTALLQSQDINLDDVNTRERVEFGVDPLINGDIDGLVGWIINEGVSVQEQGYSPQFILMSDYGVDTYDFVLFTTEAMINDNPELVQGVVNALLSGLQDVVDNPDQAIEATLSYNPELVREDQLLRLEATIPLMNVPGKPHGGMDATVWEFTHSMLLSQNIIEEEIAVEDIYTLEFLGE